MEVYNYVIMHLNQVATMKIRDLADSVHVSTTTIMRFCNKLDCNGYSEFKVKVRMMQKEKQEVVIDGNALLALLYMGIFCTGMAHLLWNQSLSMIEASICSAFYPIQPLVSVILGIIFLHENITTSFLVGCVIIVIGVLVCILNIQKKLK